jgi:perosamine synthetase
MKVPPAAILFTDEDISGIGEEISECLTTGALTLGKHGRQFEEEFAALCQTPFAIAVNSGTSALEIILRAIGVANREVIVPTNTFFATAAAVIHAGGRVRFADCEPGSFALDLGSLRECLNANTAAVIIVHIGGVISPRIADISAVCRQVGVPLIEDAAHAQGSTLDGKPAGSFGVAAAFSFYPTKVMTSGEGGMITTGDEAIYHESLIYRDQGKEGFTTNYHVRLGYNWRMSEPHAIIGRAQLRRLAEFIERRRHIAQVYDRRLSQPHDGVRQMTIPRGVESNYYKYIALLDPAIDRVSLKTALRDKFEVGLSGEVYETPCHQQPVFKGYPAGRLLKAERICAEHICLPISAKMKAEDAEYVVDSLEQVLELTQTARVAVGD